MNCYTLFLFKEWWDWVDINQGFWERDGDMSCTMYSTTEEEAKTNKKYTSQIFGDPKKNHIFPKYFSRGWRVSF